LITLQARGRPRLKDDALIKDHRAAIDRILRWIISHQTKIDGIDSLSDIHAVGHRVIHGGEKLKFST
jgi:acetate kinase